MEAGISHLCERLNARNRAQLVYRAVCEGTLPLQADSAAS